MSAFKCIKGVVIVTPLLLLSFSALAQEESNAFDDGNNMSGFFSRLLAILKALFGLTNNIVMVVGLLLVIGGFLLVKSANKSNASPVYGLLTVVVGIALGSPVACTKIQTTSIINDTRAYEGLEIKSGNVINNNNGNIMPNSEGG